MSIHLFRRVLRKRCGLFYHISRAHDNVSLIEPLEGTNFLKITRESKFENMNAEVF